MEATGSPLAATAVARDAVRVVTVSRTHGVPTVHPFSRLPALLRAGDLLVLNDAATLPASLPGLTAAGTTFELRLTEAPIDRRLVGIALGAGDWRTRTEAREPAPPLLPGTSVRIGRLPATVRAHDGAHLELDVDTTPDDLIAAIYAAGRPIQYAHREVALPLYAVQTAYAARPWAEEMPSAGRPLTWDVLLACRRAGIGIASLTHAAGIASIGDAVADRELPLPERYEIPVATSAAVAATRARGSRVIAVGTSVVRALEASSGRPGPGIATLRLTADTTLNVANGVISGLHAPGESHFELLRAFVSHPELEVALGVASRARLCSHELGDVMLVA